MIAMNKATYYCNNDADTTTTATIMIKAMLLLLILLRIIKITRRNISYT